MELTCKISNINSESYNLIILRKFFQIVFISSDFKSFDIYTALVVGGGRNANSSELNDEFSLNVVFSCADIDSKARVINKNLTDSFLDQIGCIKGVWGNESRIIENQKDFNDCLKEIYNNENPDNPFKIDNNKTNIKNGNKPIYILDKSRTDIAKSHTSIAFKGKFETKDGDDAANFTLSAGNKLHTGVEIINWVKTTVTLDKPIDEQSQFKYIIELEPTKSQYYTPDFTFYISPPPNCIVDVDTATVSKVSKIGESDENTKSSQPNLIQSVAKSSPLYYKEWKKDHHIESRKMSRLIPKSMISKVEDPSPYHKLIMNFVLKNPSKQPVAFFILGIILSSLLAFGSDSTRLTALAEYFPLNKWIQPDVFWIINCLTLFLVLFISNMRLSDTKEVRRMKICRRLSAITFVVWMFYLFVILRMDVISNVSLPILFAINTILLSIVLFANIFYLISVKFDGKITSQYPINGMLSKIWS